MRTLIVDILNDNAVQLLRTLEVLDLIRVRNTEDVDSTANVDWLAYKGAMSKKSMEEIDQQLNDLRGEWD